MDSNLPPDSSTPARLIDRLKLAVCIFAFGLLTVAAVLSLIYIRL